MAQTPHQLSQGRSGGSRQHRTGVPQVVEAKIRTTSDRAGLVEVSAQRGLGQMSPVVGGEQQGVVVGPHMDGQMLLDRLQEARRDRHGATTRLALGSADHEAVTGAQALAYLNAAEEQLKEAASLVGLDFG